jgi:5-methylcytosine-specific restriction endonuclease McrA
MSDDALIGQRFGKLTVLSRSHYNRSNGYAECLCDCGTKKIVRIDNLKRGVTISCGCALRSRYWKDKPKSNAPTKNAAQRRDRLLVERGASCQVCGFSCELALEVHHVVRVTDGGTDDWDNLVLLCANCHSLVDYLHKAVNWLRSDFPHTDEQYDKLLEYAQPTNRLRDLPSGTLLRTNRVNEMMQRLYSQEIVCT